MSEPASDPGAPSVERLIPYAVATDLAATKDFYVDVLGLDVRMEGHLPRDRYELFLGLWSATTPAAQLVVVGPDDEQPIPRFGIDVGTPAAVDAAHAAALERGLDVVYPVTDEPWGVRRFFVEDPGGNVVSVLAHLRQDDEPEASSPASS